VVYNKDSRLGNRRKQKDDCVEERFLEFHISAHFLVLLQNVSQPNVIQGVVIRKHKKDNLTKKTDRKPFVENCVRGPDVRDVL
jgi:hypothetical protein